MKVRALTSAAMLVICVTQLDAATIAVTTTNDSGLGSLRDALASAASGDSINFFVIGTIRLVSGGLVVTNRLAIVGPSPTLLKIVGNGTGSVFQVGPVKSSRQRPVSITGLSITGGGNITFADGGGIYNSNAVLIVSNCVVSGNTAFNGGAGIFNDCGGGKALLVIVNSTITSNSTSAGIGAIYNYGTMGNATLEIVNCVITNNYAFDGGGVVNNGSMGKATLKIVNSTISSNSSLNGSGGGVYNVAENGNAVLKILNCTISGHTVNGRGGGVYNRPLSGHTIIEIVNSTINGNTAYAGGGIFNDLGHAQMKISSCTISGNSCTNNGNFFGPSRGGGIYNAGTALRIGNTILNAGEGGENIVNDGGQLFSRGYDLCSDAAGGDDGTGAGGLLNARGDQRNTDPLLGPLQDNGGPTATQALLPGSPAIDQGRRNTIPGSGSGTDQRGFRRPIGTPGIRRATGGDRSDIGAYEVQ